MMKDQNTPEYATIEDVQELAIRIRKSLHNFNNALFVISGQAQLLADSYPDPDVARDMEKIFQKIQKAADILKDVHKIARRYSVREMEKSPVPDSDTSVEPFRLPKRILVADGDTWSLETLMEIIEVEGALVWTAPDYDTLLKQLRENLFQFIIVDAHPPDLDLESLVIELRMLPQGASPKLIVIGGEPQSRPNEFIWLPKPVRVDSLLPLIHEDAPEPNREDG